MTFASKWKYRSFSESVEGSGDLLQVGVRPWAPPGDLVFDPPEGTRLEGKLTFMHAVALSITGELIPEGSAKPAGVRLFGEGLGAKYELLGYFADERHIVGTVLCWRGDLAKLPAGTKGPFLLVATEGE